MTNSNMTKDEALRMAIYALNRIRFPVGDGRNEALQACKEALEQPAQSEYMVNEGGTGTVLRKQPAQEPVAVCVVMPFRGNEARRRFDIVWKNGQPIEGNLYTHPAPSWQGLSDDEIDNARYHWERQNDYKHNREIQLLLIDFARAIEQALRNKNDY